MRVVAVEKVVESCRFVFVVVIAVMAGFQLTERCVDLNWNQEEFFCEKLQ
jgi:hypothetical protein